MRSSRHRYTWHDYLVLEQSSNTKHEYFQGDIFAMGGGTPAHSALAAATTIAIGAQLKGTRCRLYQSDLRIRALATGLSTYPDVTVVCGDAEFDPQDANTIVNPTVVVEVLINSTEAYDRGEKFESYQQIASLMEYVLVSHREPRVEVLRRTTSGWSERIEAGPGGSVRLESIGCELRVDELYDGIELARS